MSAHISYRHVSLRKTILSLPFHLLAIVMHTGKICGHFHFNFKTYFVHCSSRFKRLDVCKYFEGKSTPKLKFDVAENVVKPHDLKCFCSHLTTDIPSCFSSESTL